MAEKIIHLPSGSPISLNSIGGQSGPLNGKPINAQTVHREIQFATLSSGSLVDLAVGPEGLELIVYRDGVVTRHQSIAEGETVLVPPRIDRSLVQAIRWPSYVDGDDTPESLFRDMKRIFEYYLQLTEADRDIAAFYSLQTWFSDRISVAPYLFIVGPYSCGKTTLLRLLSACCRRSVLVADISPAALYSMCTIYRPTLLMDEVDFRNSSRDRDLMRLLRNGSTAGQKVLRSGKAYELFGPKVVVSRQEVTDTALASRALVVTMRPSRSSPPPLDDATLAQIAEPLQARLASFRLRNFQRSKLPDLVCGDLTPRMRDIARALLLPVSGDTPLETRIQELLRPCDAEAKLKRKGEPEWAVTTALLLCCHRPVNYLTCGDLAFETAEILARQGETYSLSPRGIGDILRSLGFETESVGNRGRGLWYSQAIHRMIHETAANLGVTRADIMDADTLHYGGTCGYQCELCEEFGLMVDHRGGRLHFTAPSVNPVRRSSLLD